VGLRITLAGSVVIEYGDGPSRYLNSAQAQVALARLTIERREGTTRDQLADTLWPDGLPNTWSSALRSVVSRVRAFVAAALPPGPTPLEALGGRYLLHLPDDTEVDLERAEAAVAAAREASAADPAEARRLAASAAACLRAPFLPDHDGEWVAGIRHQMLELLVAGLEIASDAASALGDHGGALAYADEAIGRAPLRESAYRCRMTAHARSGNRAEALRTYQHVRRVLAEEVGVEPAPETESAYLDLLGVAAPGPGAGPGSVPPGRRPAPAAPFVGREAELSALTEAWARAAGGAAHMVLLTGESGVGKSRLAAEAARRVVQEGGLTLMGRCERDPAGACQPFVEAVGGYLASTPADALPRFGAETLARLAPVLPAAGGGVPGASRPGGADGLDSLGADADLVEPLGDVVLRLAAGRRLLVLIDDLHAGGDGTFRLLQWLSRRAAGTALLVLATSDDGRGGELFARAVHDLDRGGWLHRLALRGLDEPEIRALTRRMLPDTPREARPPAHVLSADTAGNAYLLLELLRWHGDREGRPTDEPLPLPPGIHDYAAAQLGSLEGPQRHLLRAAAVAGDSFELTPTAQAADLTLRHAIDAIEALLATGVVAEVGYPGALAAARYRFTHDVVRRALYEQLSDARRRELHTRMADAIELHCPAEQGPYVRLLAEHRAAGAAPGGDRRAVRWGWRAAARAVEDGNAAEAVDMHRRTLDHVPPGDDALRAEALTLLGLAQAQAGHAEAAHTLLDAAIAARGCGRVDIAGQAVLGLTDAAGQRLRPEATSLVDEVVAAAVAAGPPGPRAGEATINDLTFARLVARQAQADGRPAPAAAGRAMRALASELTLLVGPADPARRRTFATELLAVAAAVDDPGHQVIAAHHQATAADMEGDPVGRDEALAAMASALGGGDLAGDALLADHAVAVAVTQGRFTDAATTARLAAELSHDRFDRILPTPGSLAGRQVLVAGWLRGGSWLADHARDARPSAHAEEILLALARGDRGWAHVTLRSLATGAEPLPPDDEWSHVAGLLGLVAVEVGDPTTAEAVRQLLAPHTDLACGVGYRSYVGPVAFHLGRLAVMAGDWADAERHLTAALRRLASRQARPWLALTQLALAQALDGRGRAVDRRWAEALRAEARGTAEALGLQPDRLAPSG
jgi:DNA-binding SARP family transcriptional activator